MSAGRKAGGGLPCKGFVLVVLVWADHILVVAQGNALPFRHQYGLICTYEWGCAPGQLFSSFGERIKIVMSPPVTCGQMPAIK